jgi:hypothetical protein
MKHSRKHRPRGRNDRRGIFLLDAIVALALVTTVAMILAMCVGRVGQAEQRMADRRAAARAAEAVAARLISNPGSTAPESLDGASIRVEPVSADDRTIRAFKVVAEVNHVRAEVTGFTAAEGATR